VFGAPLFGAVVHFAPLVASVYYGVAVAARNEAVRLLDGRERGGMPAPELPATQRQVGLMDAKLRTSWWALMGSLDELGDGYDYVAGPETANAVMIAKRMVVTEAIEIASLAMDTVGGQAYLSRCVLERLFRDVRAGTFHPFTPEATLYYAGRLALGGDVDTE
jgi:alkylation response protein AidB-like acyl-CoA dehydrogenase